MDMKKFDQDKTGSRGKFANMIKTKGFYIVLVLTVVIIVGATTLITKQSLSFLNLRSDTENFIPDDFENFLTESENGVIVPEEGIIDSKDKIIDSEDGIMYSEEGQLENEQIVSGQANNESNELKDELLAIKKEVSSGETQAVKIPNNKNKEDKKPDVKKPVEPDKPLEKPKNEEKTAPTATTAADTSSKDFIMPVYGSIIYDFSMEQLAYSKTFEDWRTHSGIDIAAARGTAVKAVSHGVVIEIKEDPRLGITIVIDHENGFKTRYSNLASGDMVATNQLVEQGEAIGSIGDTASYEIALEPHLHFEVLKEDKLMDPKLYLPEY